LGVLDASDLSVSLQFGGFFEVSSVSVSGSESGAEKENIGISNYPLQTKNKYFFLTVFRIHMTLGLPDPLVRGKDPDPKPAHALAPDPSIIEQKS
jgi:hypothetical protein